MRSCPVQYCVALGSALLCLSESHDSAAQIIPDATLPVNSIVTPQGTTSIIEGGSRADGNLFHSFREFSIPTGAEAFFNNALDVQNIFSRVTGNSISNIDGLIRANGAANLFLLNPNGIIFGPNAQLNIGGSFLATTASSVRFADGTFFSTTNPQTPPLLTISVPVGLQMEPNPGNIVVQGPGHNLSFDPETLSIIRDNRPVGLQVAPGQTLTLLGGNLVLEGGNLTAEGGRIELGSVGGETLVTLTPMNPGMALSYPDIGNFQDISLSRAASVDVSGAGGGDIFVTGRRVTLTDNSVIFVFTEGAEPGGTLSIRASELVEVINTKPDGQLPSGLFASVLVGATGDGSHLTIETARLQVVNAAVVSASTSGSGNAGNLTVKATDTVELIGIPASTPFPSGLFVQVTPGATGDGGNVTIETARLQVVNGAQVSTATFGSGKAGNLTVKATDTVELIGRSADDKFGSGLFASVLVGATGDGGNVTIETARLQVVNGAQVSTATFGSGKAGNLTVKASDTVELIGRSADGKASSGLFAQVNSGATGDGGNVTLETARLRVVNGAQVSTATFGSGKAGNLTVKATDTVELIGTSAELASGLFASVAPKATGDGGNVTIETAHLQVADGAIATVRSRGEGKAGNLIVDADSIRLENSGSLTADTKAGGGSIELRSPSITLHRGSSITTNATGGQSGGDIDVQASSLILRQNSFITTNATGTKVKGGNITLNTDVIAALEDSDISANSKSFFGGQVIIDAQSVFGTQFREATTLESDITATGGTPEQRGIVQINTPDVDPSSGLIELPQNFVDATALVDRRCEGGNNVSRFVVTGRGGLPPSPNEPLSGEVFWEDWRILSNVNRQSSVERPSTTDNRQRRTNQIVEATGWIIGSKGEIILTAEARTATPHRSGFMPVNCDVR